MLILSKFIMIKLRNIFQLNYFATSVAAQSNSNYHTSLSWGFLFLFFSSFPFFDFLSRLSHTKKSLPNVWLDRLFQDASEERDGAQLSGKCQGKSIRRLLVAHSHCLFVPHDLSRRQQQKNFSPSLCFVVLLKTFLSCTKWKFLAYFVVVVVV